MLQFKHATDIWNIWIAEMKSQSDVMALQLNEGGILFIYVYLFCFFITILMLTKSLSITSAHACSLSEALRSDRPCGPCERTPPPAGWPHPPSLLPPCIPNLPQTPPLASPFDRLAHRAWSTGKLMDANTDRQMQTHFVTCKFMSVSQIKCMN